LHVEDFDRTNPDFHSLDIPTQETGEVFHKTPSYPRKPGHLSTDGPLSMVFIVSAFSMILSRPAARPELLSGKLLVFLPVSC
jgi:hypothetical protein